MTPEPLPGRRGALPWGPRHVLFGALAGAAVAVLLNLLLWGLVVAADVEFRTRDAGDAFEQAGEIAAYAGERLRAAATGEALPDPPALTADQTAIALVLAMSVALGVLLIAVVAAVTRNDIGALARRLGLTRFHAREMWRPAVALLGCYGMLAAYTAIVDGLGIDALQPESNLPVEAMRDRLTLVLAGVAVIVAAPLTEEVFYRGLIFGGLQRWGFWPAAVISGAVFSGVHLDTGSFIPFFLIGVLLAWLFWRSGSLWESIVLHVLFNAVSFSILVATWATTEASA